eukprot:s435_g10.t1
MESDHRGGNVCQEPGHEKGGVDASQPPRNSATPRVWELVGGAIMISVEILDIKLGSENHRVQKRPPWRRTPCLAISFAAHAAA